MAMEDALAVAAKVEKSGSSSSLIASPTQDVDAKAAGADKGNGRNRRRRNQEPTSPKLRIGSPETDSFVHVAGSDVPGERRTETTSSATSLPVANSKGDPNSDTSLNSSARGGKGFAPGTDEAMKASMSWRSKFSVSKRPGKLQQDRRKTRSGERRARNDLSNMQDQQQSFCAICGTKITAPTNALTAFGGQYRMLRECVAKQRPAFDRALSPREACILMEDELVVDFVFSKHCSAYRFQATGQPTIVKGPNEMAEVSYSVVTDDSLFPATQLWPALIMAFGLPADLTKPNAISARDNFKAFRSTGRFDVSNSVSDATGQFSIDLMLRVFGLDHTLTVTMSFQSDGCWVSATSALLRVTVPASPSHLTSKQFEAIGGPDASEIAVPDLEQAALKDSDSRGSEDEEGDEFSEDDLSESEDKANSIAPVKIKPQPSRRPAPRQPRPNQRAPVHQTTTEPAARPFPLRPAPEAPPSGVRRKAPDPPPSTFHTNFPPTEKANATIYEQITPKASSWQTQNEPIYETIPVHTGNELDDDLGPPAHAPPPPPAVERLKDLVANSEEQTYEVPTRTVQTSMQPDTTYESIEKMKVQPNPRAPTTPWTTATTEDGELYYVNEETGETRWDPPTIDTAAPTTDDSPVQSADVHDPIGLPVPWMKTTASDGQAYFFNEVTSETSWDPPEGAVYWFNGVAHRLVTIMIEYVSETGYNLGIQNGTETCKIPTILDQGICYAEGSTQLNCGSALLFLINGQDVVNLTSSEIEAIAAEQAENNATLVCVVSPIVILDNSEEPLESKTDDTVDTNVSSEIPVVSPTIVLDAVGESSTDDLANPKSLVFDGAVQASIAESTNTKVVTKECDKEDETSSIMTPGPVSNAEELELNQHESKSNSDSDDELIEHLGRTSKSEGEQVATLKHSATRGQKTCQKEPVCDFLKSCRQTYLLSLRPM